MINIHLAKPIECTTPRMNELQGKLWTLGDYVNAGLSLVKGCTSLVSDVGNGRGHACVRSASIREISEPSSQFYSQSTTPLKKS